MVDGKTIEERISEYDAIRVTAAKLYKTFGTVSCPALGQDVKFTSIGFNHLIYETPKKMRDKRAQVLRFDMLGKAKFIIETSTTYQEYEEEIVYKKVNRHGTWVPMNVFVRRWGLVAVVRKFRIKVVLVQEGNGSIEFLSVKPAWITAGYRNIKFHHTSVGDGLTSDGDDEVLKNATFP